MTEHTKAGLIPCVGGPWDGERAPLWANGETLIRRDGFTYILDEDTAGDPCYVWRATDTPRSE